MTVVINGQLSASAIRRLNSNRKVKISISGVGDFYAFAVSYIVTGDHPWSHNPVTTKIEFSELSPRKRIRRTK